MRHPPPQIRALWLANALVVASVVGIVACGLSWLGGMNAATSVLAGASAFAGTVALLLAIIKFALAAPE
jgi:hypothetical protein